MPTSERGSKRNSQRSPVKVRESVGLTVRSLVVQCFNRGSLRETMAIVAMISSLRCVLDSYSRSYPPPAPAYPAPQPAAPASSSSTMCIVQSRTMAPAPIHLLPGRPGATSAISQHVVHHTICSKEDSGGAGARQRKGVCVRERECERVDNPDTDTQAG
jgi:hypothetical protein